MNARALLVFSIPSIRKTLRPAAVQNAAPSTTRRSAGTLRPTAALATTSAAIQFDPSGPATARIATESPTMLISATHGTSRGPNMDCGKIRRSVSAIMPTVATARNVSLPGLSECAPEYK